MTTTFFKDIADAIKNKVNTAESVEVVYGYEKSTFAGFPAVVIVPTSNDSDYGSTESDKITYVFKVKAYYIIKDETEMEEADTAMYEVMDELSNIFRERDVLGDACDWVEPVPGEWDFEERGEAVYRTATLTLRCKKYVG
jgi:hypothetical protein